MPAKNTSPTIRPPVNPRLRNRLGTTSGSPPARRLRDSYQPKNPKTATAAAIETNVHAGQPSSRPWTSG
jgi:hypothetical protein